MRIWSILLIQSDLKWCIHLSRSLFLYDLSDRYKNTNLEEDAEILLPVKFCWILFSDYRKKVEDVESGRPRRPAYFCDRPEKHKLGRGRWILLHVIFCWIPYGGLRDVENFSANQRQGRPSLFSTGLKSTNYVEDVEILLPVKFRWIPLRGLSVCIGVYVTCNDISVIYVTAQMCRWTAEEVSEAKSKMSQPIKGEAAILFFRSAWKTQTC